MKYPLLFAWLLLFCNCRTPNTFTQHKQPFDTLIRFVAYGFAPIRALQIQSEVSSKWGFYYETVAGCTVSQAEIDSLEAYNAIAERPLVARYGKNWREKYGKDLSIAMATPKDGCLYIHFNTALKEKRKELQLQGDTLFYHFKPAKDPGTYNVDLVGWKRRGIQKTWVSYYRYHINYIKSQAKLVRQKVRSDTAFLHNNLYFSEEDFETHPRN